MKKNRPPAGEAWVWLTRDLVESDAWRSMGINARRFIDFLWLEHMGKAGTQNGKLKAPHRQLEAFGIGRRLIADAIRETELLGLVECRRAGQRAPSTYTLTWLPLHDHTPALDYWRGYRNCKLRLLSKPKPKNLQSDGVAVVQSEDVADRANLQSDGVADRAQILPSEGVALIRKNLTKGVASFSKKEGRSPPALVAASPAAAGNLRLVRAATADSAPLTVALGGRS